MASSGSTGGSNGGGSKESEDSTMKQIASTVADKLQENADRVIEIVDKQWPKIDQYIWLYIFYTFLICTSALIGIFFVFLLFRWIYLKLPPIKQWIPRLNTKIKELKVIIDEADEFSEGAEYVGIAADGPSLRGSFDEQIEELLKSVKIDPDTLASSEMK
ncbi:hypothetical protein BgAZ_502280 [Babesia gibsoni]|uniref:Uncharacterized protein n=1 Tax=Babesia gibsoni TaxID=33632 RepID=A0AAD8LNB2_BABGI|nr:hypothetical protein BgAZ_502280 [Babesia gibsoni]